ESMVLWDVATGNPVRELLFEDVQDGVLALVFSPDGTRLVSGGVSTLRLFDVIRGKQLQIFGAGSPIRALSWSCDGKTLAVGRDKEPVTLWDLGTLKEPRHLDSDPRGA